MAHIVVQLLVEVSTQLLRVGGGGGRRGSTSTTVETAWGTTPTTPSFCESASSAAATHHRWSVAATASSATAATTTSAGRSTCTGGGKGSCSGEDRRFLTPRRRQGPKILQIRWLAYIPALLLLLHCSRRPPGYFTLIDDKAPPTARDSSEVDMHTINGVIPTPENCF